MKEEIIWKIIFEVLGGLGIFLVGMNFMRDGMQMIAGSKFRKMIHVMTSNRIMGVGVGTLMTCIVQSSSITTVMVVGLVNSELMTLTQAIGVIMGANIGTTITGWILAIKIGKYGMPILGISALVFLLSKKEKLKYIALAFLGIGMIFVGLEMMKNGFKPIRSLPEFEAWFKVFNADSYFGVLSCALVGCILTVIVQSSSATLGITIGLASTGVIPFETAAALVLGENIGTTITAFLASLGTGANAKKSAYFHIIFNLLGVLWITAVFRFYMPIISWISESIYGGSPNFMKMVDGEQFYPYITAAIATVHTGFNVINTLIFLPFTGKFANLLDKFGSKEEKENDNYYTHLDFTIHDSPYVALEQSKHEITRMDEKVKQMMDNLNDCVNNPETSEKQEKELFERENILDHVQKEITTFITDILGEKVPHDVAYEGQVQLRMADEYESISDEITGILKLHLRLKEQNVILSPEQLEELNGLHHDVSAYYNFIHQKVESDASEFMDQAHKTSRDITEKIRNLRTKHWGRLQEVKVDPLITTTYMDVANSYRRIKDHLLNIAEAICGEKLVA